MEKITDINNLNINIECLISDLIPKVREHVPETGDFTAVYSEFKNTDKRLCLTDIMLKVEAASKNIENHINRRYLTCVGYKLPAPFRSSNIIKAGTKSEILDYLNEASLAARISETVQHLSDNLLDV